MQKTEKGTNAFILATFTYGEKGKQISQRKIVNQISKFPEVQESHIISGNWDILLKVKMRDVDAIGKFITDKLRKVRGIERTQTCIVFYTGKES